MIDPEYESLKKMIIDIITNGEHGVFDTGLRVEDFEDGSSCIEQLEIEFESIRFARIGDAILIKF